MLKLYFLLYYEFLKIGTFAVGGGYATLPFLYYVQEQYKWFSVEELTNMIAVSNITPGPIGINMATYTGFTTGGILGSIIATTAIITGPFLITYAICKLMASFKKNNYIVKSIFTSLRAASCALLTSIALELSYKTISTGTNFDIDEKALILFSILFVPFYFIKKNPLLIIIAGALGGILIRNI